MSNNDDGVVMRITTKKGHELEMLQDLTWRCESNPRLATIVEMAHRIEWRTNTPQRAISALACQLIDGRLTYYIEEESGRMTDAQF